ncbi:MAG: ATP synthase F0 subunit B [Candidatus Aminicenantes bacterium]|jgi:F-type H+-transporting ATPase subunit b
MLSIDASAIVIFAIVWVLVLVLGKIFFKPITRILDARAGRMARDQAAASEALEAYDRDLRRIEESLKEARAAADGIREKAELEALKEKSRLVREVQAAGRAEVEKAKEELARQVEALKAELETRSGEFAEKIEKRILNG